MFTRFGGLTDQRVRAQITRGQRIRALIGQPRFAALRRIDQVALIAALEAGVFDALPVAALIETRAGIGHALDAEAGAAAQEVARGDPLSEASRKRLVEIAARVARGPSP